MAKAFKRITDTNFEHSIITANLAQRNSTLNLEVVNLSIKQMKPQQPLTELSTEELNKKAKTLKIATIFMGFSVLIMLICGIIVSMKKGFSALTVTPLAFAPLLIIFSSQLKQVNNELKKRETA